MLAVNHVTLATGMTLGLSVYLGEPFFLPFIAFVVFTSLLPDIDHSGSEISRYFPFFGRLFKHRGPTHSVLGLGVFTGLIYVSLSFSMVLSYILMVMAMFGLIFLSKIINRRVREMQRASNGSMTRKDAKGLLNILLAVIFLFFGFLAYLIHEGAHLKEIIVLLSFGFFAHIFGDFLTKEGVPLFWPNKKRFGLKLFKTSGTGEKVFGVLLILANFFLLYSFFTKFGLDKSAYWEGYLSF